MESSAFVLSPLGQIVWEDRYALKDEQGIPTEKNILDTFKRSAKGMAAKEKMAKKWEEKFFSVLAGKQFCPAGRILAHSGTHYSQLLNCFVLKFRNDSLEEIMHTASDMALVQKFGGGTGFNYSNLRPSGSYIKGVNGHSCGVIGFTDMMSKVSEVIEQGGSRRGANLGLLEVWHPDVWEFISYKSENNWDSLLEFMDVKDQDRWASFKFNNLYKWQMYNVSIGVSEEFFDALKKDAPWPFMWEGREWELYTVVFKKLIGGKFVETKFDVTADCERTALWKTRRRVPYPTASDIFEVVSRRRVKASEVWQKICYNAWADGCPGLLNMTTIRKFHNMEYCNPVLSTNPCGEQPLPAFSACLLGSLILPTFVTKAASDTSDQPAGKIDWPALKTAVHVSVRFMDDVIDNCEFPLNEIKETVLSERRIGLGTMGVHDMLIAMELGYDTEQGRTVVEKVLQFIRDESYRASVDLAKEKGAFPLFNAEKFLQSAFIQTLPQDIRDDIAKTGIRNCAILSQAPTGTIGTMLNYSTGCEPWFNLSFQRNTRLGSYEDGCPQYLKWKSENPGKTKPSYFKTSQEISPEDHVKMMILFSKYMDSAVSKTVNLPNSATVEDVKKTFLFAMENGVKGVTVFRDGSKEGVLVKKVEKAEPVEQVLETMYEEGSKTEDKPSEDTMKIRQDGLQPKKRGNRTVGATYRVHMEKHNLYVVINRNSDGDLVEIFATVGENKVQNTHHTSGIEDSWAEGLAKIISLALRAGVNPQAIIRNLKNIPSDKPVFTTIGDLEGSELIPSPPHAIGRAMEEELRYVYPDQHKLEVEKAGSRCESCGSTNIHWKSPTCYECLDCPYSKCG